MQNGYIKIRTLRKLETLLIPLVISLISMYVIGIKDPNKIDNLTLNFLLATFIVGLFSVVSFNTLLRYSYIFYIITVIFLILVLVKGSMAGGATRWICFGPFRFQPSELLKLVLPLTLINYYKSQKLPLSKIRIFKSILIVAIPVFLVLNQPDLGSSIVIVTTAAFVPFLLGLKKRTIQITVCLIIVMLPLFWNLLLHYQKLRILANLWPNRYSDYSFQVKQALLAIKKGGLLGQNNIDYDIPACTTDFIFSAYAYNFGFLGVVILLILFKRLIKNMIRLAKTSSNPLFTALAGTYAFLILCSLLVNTLMATGILPVVGLPLPLMSYGGTAFIVNIIIVTIIASAFRNPSTVPNTNFCCAFRTRQFKRLNILTNFMNIGFFIIAIRLLFIYFN